MGLHRVYKLSVMVAHLLHCGVQGLQIRADILLAFERNMPQSAFDQTLKACFQIGSDTCAHKQFRMHKKNIYTNGNYEDTTFVVA